MAPGVTPAHVALVSRLMRVFPSITQAGCHVGNGLATGLNRVYVTLPESKRATAAVEDAFWMPTVLPEDVSSGDIAWRGHHLLNLWACDDKLVDPQDYPGLNGYLSVHRADLEDRYVARCNPDVWFRTIDRVKPGLCAAPKLLVADIQLKPRFALDTGRFYPRNGVYYILSEAWPLDALRLVLESGLAHLLIAAIAPTVRGGGFRCQAQYLSKMPLVPWPDVTPDLKRDLVEAARASRDARPDLVARLFGLTEAEEALLSAGADVI